MATAKAAAKQAARPAAKAAPAPAPAPVEQEAAQIEVGSEIVFLGYGDDVPAEEQVLEANTIYTVAGFTDPDPENPEDQGGDIIVNIPNPSFNAKKKESDENPKEVAVVVMPDEYEMHEAEEEAPAPAPVAVAPKQTKAVGKAASPAAKTAAGKPAAKTTAKPAAKTAPKVEEPEEPGEPSDSDDGSDLPELQTEDPDVLALLEGDVDPVAVAVELEQRAAVSEYQLGGVLYHIRHGKKYLEVEGGDKYNVKGGWAMFIGEFFAMDYRKAMTLIDIYVQFSLSGIEAPSEQVVAIGWSKAAKIAKYMTDPTQTPANLVELAATNTSAQLSEIIKDTIKVGGTPGEAVKRITLKFRYLEAQADAIVATINAVKASQGIKKDDEALAYIVNDWAMHNTAQAPVAPAQARAVGKPAAKAAAPAAKPAAKAAPRRAAA